MKFLLFTLSSVAIFCCLISFVEAAPERQKRGQKRSVAREMCPENTTPEQCEAYANEQSKTYNYCHRFVHGRGWLEWQSCGSISCGGNTILVPEDLSKPYPDCCERCMALDSSKPATISGVA